MASAAEEVCSELCHPLLRRRRMLKGVKLLFFEQVVIKVLSSSMIAYVELQERRITSSGSGSGSGSKSEKSSESKSPRCF
mmetsp:Transcript_33777/g.60773  ORF Transcript_33777/g.60773 Transcript_33777/m.60773 type:complete len:80 (-) Transcript_33777:158-397(-)